MIVRQCDCSFEYLILSAAPNDYVPLNEVITFQPTPALQTDCRLVLVIDDVVLEADEEFLISLETSDPRVILTMENTTVSVTIADNDEGICVDA